jgi:TolB-like protein
LTNLYKSINNISSQGYNEITESTQTKGTPMRLKWISLFLILSFILALPSLSVAQTQGPSKVYKVAILPFLIHSQENLDYLREGIYDILSSRITVEGRIAIIDRSVVERALYEERPMRLDEAVAKNIGMRVEADYVVLGSLTKIGDYISLDARLISITEDKPPLGVYTQHKGIDDVMVKIGDFAQDIGYKILGRRAMVSPPTEERPSFIIRHRGEDLGIRRSQTFAFEIKGIDIGDVDGDGKNEVVIMDYHNLYVFKYDGEKLVLFLKIETGFQNNFLTLDVADVNRNGFAEIIVTSVVEDNLRSFILEYEEGKFRKITDKAGWFFRVLDHPKDGPTLIGQQMGSEGVPAGRIYKFLWKKKSFEKGEKMPFPRGTKIFGLAMGNVRDKGTKDIILLDDSDRLKIMSPDGKFSWGSGEQFGETDNSYETKRKIEAIRTDKLTDTWRVYIHGRIIVKDLDGDGLDEVIVNKNNSTITVFEKAKLFTSGEVCSLVWNGKEIVINWKTQLIKGYIADYQIKDVDNDGEPELVVAITDSPGSRSMLAGNVKSNILFFKLF